MKLGVIGGGAIAALTLGACCLDTVQGFAADAGGDAGTDSGPYAVLDAGVDAGFDAGTPSDAGECSSRPSNLNSVTSFAAGQFYAAVSGDVNGDGLLDLVGGSLDPGDGAQLLYGLADAGLSLPIVLEQGSSVDTVAIGDLDGDGIPDIVAAELQLMLFFGDGGGGFTLVSIPIPAGWSGVQGLGIGDFNGDGAPDLFVEAFDPDNAGLPIEVLVNRGARGFSEPVLIPGVQGQFVVADLNQDGLADLVAETTDGYLAVLLSTLDGGFNLNRYPYPVAGGSVSLLPGESGAPDAIASVEPAIGGYLGIYLLRNSGTGTFTLGAEVSTEGYGSTAIGDFNGDCIPDVAILSGSSCDDTSPVVISVVYGQAQGTFGAPQPLSAGPLIPFAMFPMGPVNSPHALGFGTPCTNGNGAVIYGDASR